MLFSFTTIDGNLEDGSLAVPVLFTLVSSLDNICNEGTANDDDHEEDGDDI